jgi:hypothetical protein
VFLLSSLPRRVLTLGKFLLADIVKMIDSQPDLAPLIRRVRGGYLKIQGTWMPYEVALKLSRRVAWTIREDLVPLFGYALSILVLRSWVSYLQYFRLVPLFQAPAYHQTNLVMARLYRLARINADLDARRGIPSWRCLGLPAGQSSHQA